MEKLSNDAKDFSIWTFRLTNTVKQINPVYATLLELIRRLPSAVVPYDGWCANYANALREHSQTEESMCTRMSSDLYTSLVDKCTNGQVMMVEKDELDVFHAYSQLYRSSTRTAGLGSLARREYLTNRQVAKKETEDYDLIVAWKKSNAGGIWASIESQYENVSYEEKSLRDHQRAYHNARSCQKLRRIAKTKPRITKNASACGHEFKCSTETN